MADAQGVHRSCCPVVQARAAVACRSAPGYYPFVSLCHDGGFCVAGNWLSSPAAGPERPARRARPKWVVLARVRCAATEKHPCLTAGDLRALPSDFKVGPGRRPRWPPSASVPVPGARRSPTAPQPQRAASPKNRGEGESCVGEDDHATSIGPQGTQWRSSVMKRARAPSARSRRRVKARRLLGGPRLLWNAPRGDQPTPRHSARESLRTGSPARHLHLLTSPRSCAATELHAPDNGSPSSRAGRRGQASRLATERTGSRQWQPHPRTAHGIAPEAGSGQGSLRSTSPR